MDEPPNCVERRANVQFARQKPSLMVHVIVAVLGVFAALWSLAICLIGGFTLSLLGTTVRAHDPFRPLAVAVVCALIYAVTKGPLNVRRLISPLAILLGLSTALAGIARNSWTAGGADSYAYVSQAELWLNGSLTVPVPLAASAPWPDTVWTFSPHGFRPAVSEAALVPVTAPGLPILMAGANAIAGHCAMFLVTPLCGALLVWVTFAIGRRLVSEIVGLGAAWLIATSPAVLAMLVSPMSDVPAAASWAAAVYFALGSSNASSIAAGLASSGAILIRPNLAPLAAILVVWKLWAGLKPSATDRLAFVRSAFVRPALLIAAGTIPGCLFIAWVNATLYGSPVLSGYGALSDLFSMSNVLTNLRRYGGWLIESQTPLALVGIAALLVPIKAFGAVWRTPSQLRGAMLLGAMTTMVWALYLIYTPYDAWWFLRFLLPSWPAICIGAAAVVVRIAQDRGRPLRSIAIILMLLVGGYGIQFAVRHGAFPSGEGDHRYVSIAKLVEQVTDPSAVVFAGQNGGPTRYYAGRTIVRFDLIEPEWIDRAAQWLTEHGRPPYFLLEDWDLP
ncbi:MAG TPA: glycosyltransferase family 39 protein, partial [Bradyrhizobium sp.]|nr:glycosyltransferase family 39 protein [Bradyrhizobium sp.]